MKIIKVVVDKLPKSTMLCRFSNYVGNFQNDMIIDCDILYETVCINDDDYVEHRCFSCPLAEET